MDPRESAGRSEQKRVKCMEYSAPLYTLYAMAGHGWAIARPMMYNPRYARRKKRNTTQILRWGRAHHQPPGTREQQADGQREGRGYVPVKTNKIKSNQTKQKYATPVRFAGEMGRAGRWQAETGGRWPLVACPIALRMISSVPCGLFLSDGGQTHHGCTTPRRDEENWLCSYSYNTFRTLGAPERTHTGRGQIDQRRQIYNAAYTLLACPTFFRKVLFFSGSLFKTEPRAAGNDKLFSLSEPLRGGGAHGAPPSKANSNLVRNEETHVWA